MLEKNNSNDIMFKVFITRIILISGIVCQNNGLRLALSLPHIPTYEAVFQAVVPQGLSSHGIIYNAYLNIFKCYLSIRNAKSFKPIQLPSTVNLY